MSESEPVIRPYDPDRDLAAVQRIWREVGWTTPGKDAEVVGPFHEAGRTLVYEIDGAAESSVHVTQGVMRYQRTDLRLAAVTAVTTSHVARRRGAAATLLARMLAEDAEDGAVVAALGMFEQGFYDRFGFGTLSYLHQFEVDPRSLMVDRVPRPPQRVTLDDWQDVHRALGRRRRGHGGLVLQDAELMRAELRWNDPPFGLGYRDDEGHLTHFVFGEAKAEHGPYRVGWLVYQDIDQLLELLALLRTLGDQVDRVVVVEPPDLQLQDLLRTPFREGRRTGQRPGHSSTAWQQLRVLDVAASVAVASFDREPVRFNLDLTDPVTAYLPEGTPWRGSGGTWVVTLGPTSSAEPGAAPDLPTLRTGVGAFSRMLWGVRPASVLANSTDLTGPPELLAALDRTIDLPEPRLNWDF